MGYACERIEESGLSESTEGSGGADENGREGLVGSDFGGSVAGQDAGIGSENVEDRNVNDNGNNGGGQGDLDNGNEEEKKETTATPVVVVVEDTVELEIPKEEETLGKVPTREGAPVISTSSPRSSPRIVVIPEAELGGKVASAKKIGGDAPTDYDGGG